MTCLYPALAYGVFVYGYINILIQLTLKYCLLVSNNVRCVLFMHVCFVTFRYVLYRLSSNYNRVSSHIDVGEIVIELKWQYTIIFVMYHYH